MKFWLVAAAVIATLVQTPVFAADYPAVTDVAIEKISYRGSGCPKNSAAVNLSPDLRAFTVIFSKYQASIDNAPRLSRVARDCDVDIDLRVPDGWSFMIYTVDYRGYVALTEGATAELDSRVRFRGVDPHSRIDGVEFKGPVDQDYFLRHTLNAKTFQRSDCRGAKRHLGIRSSVTVTAKKGASAVMSVDSLDEEVNQTYWIAWERCKK